MITFTSIYQEIDDSFSLFNQPKLTMYSIPIPSLALKLKGLIHPGMAPLSWKPNSSPISFLHDQIAAGRFSSKLQIKKIIGSNSSHFVYCPSRALSLSRLSCLECLPYRWRTLPSTASLTSKLINSTVLSFLLPAAYQSCLPLPSTIQLFFPRISPSDYMI